MKVKDSKEISALREVSPRTATAPAAPAGNPAEPGDRVSVDATASFSQAVEEAKRSSNVSRTAKLESLKQAIKQGQYQPNPQQIADRILDAAALNASLRAMLKR